MTWSGLAAATLCALSVLSLAGPAVGPAVGLTVNPVDGPTGQWPVDEPVITSGFRPPDEIWGPGHRGVDLAARTGTAVRAMVDGVVSFVGTIAGKPVVALSLPGAGHRRVTYEPVTGTLPVGSSVLAGDVVGTVAAAGGHCGGRAGCLHLGLRTDQGYQDPLSLVRRRPAVLKPT